MQILNLQVKLVTSNNLLLWKKNMNLEVFIYKGYIAAERLVKTVALNQPSVK